MAENIDGSDLLASGGHQWHWDGPAPAGKVVGTAGVAGGWSMVTAVGPRRGRVAGLGGRGPALLTASGASKAEADTYMDVLEGAIAGLVVSGEAVEYEDDAGHVGTRLTLTAYRRVGPRTYAVAGATNHCWQRYVLELLELDGGPT